MREPKLDLEITDDQRAVLVVGCPECGDKSRFLLDQVTPGTSILCNCGGVMSVSPDSLETIKQKFDSSK